MKLGLLAGSGEIPKTIAEHTVASGDSIFIVAIRGFEEDWMKAYPHQICGIAEFGAQIKAFRSAQCDTISFIGNVKRPDFSNLKPDLKGMSILPKVIRAASKGDDALLRTVIECFEKEGFAVIGAQELLKNLNSPAGLLTRRPPNEADLKDIQRAFDVAGEIGRLDIGQGAVVARGLVLAVEAQEGTDEMLKRVARLPDAIRGTEDVRCGVLLKRPKPIQEARIDLPTAGCETVRRAAEAGLSTLALVEDGALLVNQTEMIDLANAYDMTIVVLRPDGGMP